MTVIELKGKIVFSINSNIKDKGYGPIINVGIYYDCSCGFTKPCVIYIHSISDQHPTEDLLELHMKDKEHTTLKCDKCNKSTVHMLRRYQTPIELSSSLNKAAILYSEQIKYG